MQAIWSANSAKTVGLTAYSNAALYNSTAVYSGIDVTLSDSGNKTSAWAATVIKTGAWQSNSAKYLTPKIYSDGTLYNSPVNYSGVDVTLPEYGNKITAWLPPVLSTSTWSGNAAASANQYAFDSGVYDATATYDGLVVGQGATTNVPSQWT